MRLPRECYQMQQVIETHLPHLSRPQLTGLVLWVCGAILAGSACQNAVASALSPWGRWNNLRQYLREWLYDGGDRARPCQTELDVSLCFAPLLRWVLVWWRSGRLALAVDPTLKGDQTTAIVISVVYRGCARPREWRIHRATQRGSWMDPTVELLRELAPAVPQEMTVIVLCDRGIASPKLWRQIRAQGWHPYMRIGRTSASAPKTAAGCPHSTSFPVPIRPGLAAAPPSAPPTQNAVAPCWRSGTSSRKNLGSSSLTCRRRTPDPVGTPCASGSNWASRPSKAWAGSGTRPGAPTRRASPATGWCCRWQHCWPWPMAPGWKTPMTAGLLQATCARRPRRRLPGAATLGVGRYGPSASSATALTGCGGCCSGAASGAGSGCCLSPGRNPSPTWRLLAMPLPKNPLHTPVSSPPDRGMYGLKLV